MRLQRLLTTIGASMLLVAGACGDDTSAVGVDTDPTAGTGTGGDDDGGPASNTNATMTTAMSDSLDGTSSDGSDSGPTTLDDTRGDESSSEGGESSSEGGGPACGDDNVDAGEQCDGTNLDGEDCGSQGFDRGVLACAADCTFDTSGCINTPTCGDGDVGVGEDCDGANLDGQTCATQGFPAGGTLACANDCTFDTSGCNAQPTCGNGGIDAGEDCDGANLDGETCVTQGFAGGTLACAGNCTFDTSACTNPPPCGNGALDAGETCDGANLDGQTCATQGFDGGTLACAADCGSFDTSGCTNLPSCGDGTCDAGEDSCSCVADCPDNADSCSACECGGDGGNCFCDDLCVGFGDCCADACANCGQCAATCGDGVCDPGEDSCSCASDCADDPNSCSACECGGSGGSCFCDDACVGFGDCCADACANCGQCGGGSCAHPICETGAALTSGCDPCVTQVCAVDAFCCSNSWDSICVGEVTSVCGIPCGGATCGNGGIDAGEACDGANLNGQTCVTQGFPGGGTLACAGDCASFDTSGCSAGGCAHPICQTGAALTSGCDPCVTQVCAVDAFCCSTSWDSICVGEVTSVCGIPCGGGPVCGDGVCGAGEDSCNCAADCPDDPNSCSACQCGGSGGSCFCDDACVSFGDCCADACANCGQCGGGSCAHPLCQTGGPLTSGCDPCVTQICAVDAFCCNNSWDSLCVGQVGSVCGTPCP